MINGPWMMLRAKALARRLKRLVGHARRSGSHDGLSRWPSAARRPPTNRDAAVEFLQTSSASGEDALVDFCHVLLNSNEFLYVD